MLITGMEKQLENHSMIHERHAIVLCNLEIQMETSSAGESNITIFNQNKNNNLANFDARGIKQLSTYLSESSSQPFLAPDLRSVETTLSTTSQSQWNKKNYEYDFRIERKVAGLPSILINKMQHSGTHFLTTRLSVLGYANSFLQRNDNPWIDRTEIQKFNQGGFAALTELEANPYNVNLFGYLLTKKNAKIVMHFRDPRSIMVSAIHLMYSKGRTKEEIYLESLKRPSSVINIDFHALPFEQRLDYYITKFYPKWANFTNSWVDFICRLKPEVRKKILITEFNKDLTGKSELYLKKLVAFVSDINEEVTVTKDFFEPDAANSHFRKGLIDEWREVCTKEQIKWMTDQLHPRTMEYFGWEKE